LLLLAVIVAIVIAAWRLLAVKPFTVPRGARMSPTLNAGQRAYLDRLSYLVIAPHRGDMIAVAAPGNGLGFVILRVVALPGETVEVKDGALRIDGAAVAESYARGRLSPRMSLAPTRVPRGSYFALPDNRAYAAQARAGPMVRQREILGRVAPAGR
jgi:signal peptidase I